MAKKKTRKASVLPPSRMLLDPRLAASIHAMLDKGFEPAELAERCVAIIIQIAGERNDDLRQLPASERPGGWTREGLIAAQQELEADWGGASTQRRVRQSLDDMAEAGNK